MHRRRRRERRATAGRRLRRQGDALVSADGRTAFVTGGSGFIGGRLIHRLVGDGWRVRALARSDASAAKVSAPAPSRSRGDLDDARRDARRRRRAPTSPSTPRRTSASGARARSSSASTCGGTRNAVEAARAAGVRRFVHVGTEAGAARRRAARERERGRSAAPGLEGALLRHQGEGRAGRARRQRRRLRDRGRATAARVGRGRHDDPAGLVPAVEKRRFAWIGGGHHRTSTTHVDNVIDGLMLGAERGRPGGVYFVTDGEPVVFRDFITELLGTQGVDAARPQHAGARSRASRRGRREGVWRTLSGSAAARPSRASPTGSRRRSARSTSPAPGRSSGYEPVRSIPEGMEELRREHAGLSGREREHRLTRRH